MSQFFNMGGYGVYVWSSYGIALVAYALVYFIPMLKHKKILKQLKGRYKREMAQNNIKGEK